MSGLRRLLLDLEFGRRNSHQDGGIDAVAFGRVHRRQVAAVRQEHRDRDLVDGRDDLAAQAALSDSTLAGDSRPPDP